MNCNTRPSRGSSFWLLLANHVVKNFVPNVRVIFIAPLHFPITDEILSVSYLFADKPAFALIFPCYILSPLISLNCIIIGTSKLTVLFSTSLYSNTRWCHHSFTPSTHSVIKKKKKIENWPHSDMMPSPEGAVNKYGTIFDLRFHGLVGDVNTDTELIVMISRKDLAQIIRFWDEKKFPEESDARWVKGEVGLGWTSGGRGVLAESRTCVVTQMWQGWWDRQLSILGMKGTRGACVGHKTVQLSE